MSRKSIHLYKLILEESKMRNLFNEDEVSFNDKVQQLSENHYESDKFQIFDNKVFMLISFDKQHIFGTFGKMDDVSKGGHVRARNKENYSLESIQNLIESYTYFYLNLNNNQMALLHNHSIPDVKKPFARFISSHFRISGLYENIELLPLISEKIPNGYGRKIPILSAKISYGENSLPENDFLAPSETAGINNSDIRSADIKLTMKPGAKADKDKFKFINKNYSEFTLETENETIDLVNNIIIKKTTVEMDSDQLKDEEFIKDILRNATSDVF